jgi:hypothetical protein
MRLLEIEDPASAPVPPKPKRTPKPLPSLKIERPTVAGFPEELIREAVALRLFLQDGRFQDQRSAAMKSENRPISTGNCFAASILLEHILSEIYPRGGWTAKRGWFKDEFHAFVFGRVEGQKLVADITADQFDQPEVVFRTHGPESGFDDKHDLTDDDYFDSYERKLFNALLRKWKTAAEKYRKQADRVLANRKG